MLKRENGWALSDTDQDIWRELIDDKRRRFYTLPIAHASLNETRYVNNVTGDIQDVIPIQFRGGLLADPMGLGKTLSTIALIASDRNRTGKMAIAQDDSFESILTKRKTTLLVAPSTREIGVSSLQFLICGTRSFKGMKPTPQLNFWLTTFCRHLKPGTLRWVTHHGQRRLTTTTQICQYDIVLTSYQTITSEWRKRESVSSPVLLHRWHRIALDEGEWIFTATKLSSPNIFQGHQIRNTNTIASKALCSLESRSRWIVTGTPIQNRLSDLMSLLQFLRLHPYNETTMFEAHIVEPWKRGNEEQAIQRLKKLFMAIALRRSKSVVELPARVNDVRRLEFTETELAQYREAENSIASTLDDAIRTGRCASNLYANALQRINQLRMICNLGTFIKFSKEESNKSLPQDQWNDCTAQAYLNSLITVGAAKCAECGVDLESISQHASEESPEKSGGGRLFECLLLLCSQCFQKRDKKRSSHCYSCGKSTPCQSAVVSTSCSSSELSNDAWASGHPTEFPTKVKTLVEDIKSLPSNTKR
jgi:SNF2 family DNA or RNA helicase